MFRKTRYSRPDSVLSLLPNPLTRVHDLPLPKSRDPEVRPILRPTARNHPPGGRPRSDK